MVLNNIYETDMKFRNKTNIIPSQGSIVNGNNTIIKRKKTSIRIIPPKNYELVLSVG